MLKTFYKGIVFLLTIVWIMACSVPGNGSKQQEAPGTTGQTARQAAEQAAGQRHGSEQPDAGGGPLPKTSLYQFEGEWHSQQGDTLQLKSLRGKIPIVAMVFTHCEFACPRIISDMKKIQKEIPAGKTDQVVFVLVSFDSQRDQPERLKEYAKEVNLDADWLLLHGNEEEVRMLSMLLAVSYQKQAGGAFAHSNIITLLNKEGQISSQVEGLGADATPIVSKIDKL